MSWDADIAIVGAGVVGLAVARECALRGRSVFVLERHEGPGRETSSHNSQVIHAGMYYPPGSWRARLCVEGNRQLYAFCARYDVPHRRLGKLIVATTAAEAQELSKLLAKGEQNGVSGLALIDQTKLGQLEPRVRALCALHSPATGILDAHEFVKALEALSSQAGARILYRAPVIAAEQRPFGYTLRIKRDHGEEQLTARVLINAAGLGADRLALLLGLTSPTLHWCRGDYFSVTGPAAKGVTHLLYPMPNAHLVGLGIHVTLDLAGRMLLGPDTTYILPEAAQADIPQEKAQRFHQAVTRFLPDLPLNAIQPDSSGIRPKRQGPNDPWQDFYIADEKERGLPGLINLIGIDSPGLTAALPLAAHVCTLAEPYCV